MTLYPYSNLFVGSSRTIAISGYHIQVLDSTTGQVLYSTVNLPQEEKEKLAKDGPIRCTALSSSERYLATAADDKMLKIWKVEELKLSSSRELPKKPTSIAFTKDEQTILVSDKFGDVFSYDFAYVPLTEKQKRDALSSHENPSGGKLILGHASPLNAFILTPDEKYIITADRDEHIRVSWYPQGYCIERYCLGHEKFVSAIHIPQSDASILVSGGGDPMLKFWDWLSGNVKHELEIATVVDPFLVVRVPKRKRGSWDEDGGDAGESNRTKRKKAKVKARADAKKREASGDATPEPESTPKEEPEHDGEEATRKVFAVHRIGSVNTSTGEYLVFSAVGATALFAFPFKLGVTSEEVQSLDFGIPVIDFVVSINGNICVSLDQNYTSGTDDRKSLQVVKITDGKLETSDKFKKDLVTSLNSSSRLPATVEELKALDLYGDLSSLPKHNDPDAVEGGDGASVAEGSSKAEKPQTKREIGRLRKKQAVLAQLQAAQETGVSTPGDDTEVPESKRPRSEHGGVDWKEQDSRDVMMEG